jgi:CheY-like chemotaxis protein
VRYEGRRALRRGGFVPTPVDDADPTLRGRQRPLMKQADRAIDWQRDDTARVLARINAADGFPGVADRTVRRALPPVRRLARKTRCAAGAPGEVIAWRETAILRATVDGAVWIGHLRRRDSRRLRSSCRRRRSLRRTGDDSRSRRSTTLFAPAGRTWQDIRYEEAGGVGFLHFDFYNGAMSTRQCRRLQAAYAWARQRPVSVLVLMGGRDYWSNGIHLQQYRSGRIAGRRVVGEHQRHRRSRRSDHPQRQSSSRSPRCRAIAVPAAASWRALPIWSGRVPACCSIRITATWATSMARSTGPTCCRRGSGRGSAGDHAQPLADDCRCRRRGGFDRRLPGRDADAFRIDVARRAAELAAAPDLAERLQAKRAQRLADETAKPLASYRHAELAELQRNFYGFDPSYHVARFPFRAQDAELVDAAPSGDSSRSRLERAAMTASPKPRLPTVLVVDDEMRSQEALRRTLEDDFEVFTASSAEQAQRIMETEWVQIIVCDQRMPGMTGVEFLKTVRSQWPDTLRIILSGYTDAEDIIAGVNEAGIYQYLMKPWQPEQLLLTLQTAARVYRLQQENQRLSLELRTAEPVLARRVELKSERAKREFALDGMVRTPDSPLNAVCGLVEKIAPFRPVGADQRRVGYRQGDAGARHPLLQPACRQGLRHRALRCAARPVARSRAVRLQARCLHRRL